MEFGKLANTHHLDSRPPSEWRLPELSVAQAGRNARVLARAGKSWGHLFTGTPIWAEKRWIGTLYPLQARAEEFLHHYSRQLNTIELNLTHYRAPDEATVLAWRRETPSGFKFCPKFPQSISHHAGLQHCENETQRFCAELLKLEDRLGTTFLQLPPGFHPGMLPVLKRFLQGLPKGFPVCVEFRHSGWFTAKAGGAQTHLLPGALDVLEQLGVGTVITDVVGRRDVLHLALSAPRVMIRFIGTTDQGALRPSDLHRLEAWVPTLQGWMKEGLKELYFMAHSPDSLTAPDVANELIHLMGNAGIPGLRRWTPQDQGKQLSLL